VGLYAHALVVIRPMADAANRNLRYAKARKPEKEIGAPGLPNSIAMNGFDRKATRPPARHGIMNTHELAPTDPELCTRALPRSRNLEPGYHRFPMLWRSQRTPGIGGIRM